MMKNRRRPETPEGPTSPMRRPSTQPAARGARRRRALQTRLLVDALEERTLLAASVTIDASDALSFVANTASMVTVSYDTGTSTYTINDNAEVINVTNNGTGIVTGNGSGTITVTNNTSIDVDLNGTSSSAIVNSNNTPTTLHDSVGGGDYFQIGNGGSQSINGAVTIGSTVTSSTAEVDDSGDLTGQTVTVSSTSVTGLTPASIDVSGSNLSSLNLLAGSAADTFTVTGTRTATILQGSTSGDTVNVQGTNAGAALSVGGTQAETINIGDAGSVQGILGTVTISNNNNGSTITVDDSADATARIVSIGSVTLSGLAPASINFLGSEPTAIEGGSGGNTFTITGTPTNATTLDSGTGDDTVNVQATDAGRPLVIHGQDGSDTVHIGSAGSLLSTISSSVTLDNASGSTALSIDDSGDTNGLTATLTGTQLTGAAPAAIDYADLSSLSASFGSGAVTVDVTGTPAGATTTLGMGGSTSNAVNLGDPSNAAGSLGDVTVTGTTALTIDDSADLTGQTVAVNGSDLKIGTAPDFTYGGASLVGLVLDASDAGSNTVDVTSTPALSGATPLTLNMGTGTGNLVDLGMRADSYGSVTLTTGTGGTTGLTVDDSSGNGGWTVGVSATAIGFLAGPTYDYSGASLSGLTLNLDNDGGNTVDVTGTPALPPGQAVSISAFTGTGDAINLGDATHAASGLGSVTLSSGGGAPLAVTVDDSAGAAGGTIGVTSTGVSFGVGGPTFDLTNATLGGLTIDSSNLGGTTVDVTGTPAETNPMALNMGSGGFNTINLGDATHAAASLGDITMFSLGSGNDLVIDDSADGTSASVDITASSLVIGAGPVFDYAYGDLSSLTFDGAASAQTTVNVTGPPSGAPLTLDMGSSLLNMVNLGDPNASPVVAASSLGDVTVTGHAGLDIDDTADAAAETYTVTSSSLSIGSGPVFDYSNATLGVLWFYGGTGSDVMNITGVPVAGLTPSLYMGGTTSSVANIGDASHAASTVGSVFLASEAGAPITVTIDDSAGAAGQFPLLGASSFSFNPGDVITYSGVNFTDLTFKASDSGSTTVRVQGSPNAGSGLAPISLDMGDGAGNAVNLGDPTHAASRVGDVSIFTEVLGANTGSTSLTVDDSNGAGGATVTVGDMSTDFTGGPSVNYGGANLTGLAFDASSAGGNHITVIGVPQSLTSAATIHDGAPAVAPDSIAIGDAGDPASGLLNNLAIVGTGATSLTIDDVGSEIPGVYSLQGGQFTFGASPTIEFDGETHLTGLTIQGGSQGSAWHVTGTPPGVPTLLVADPGSLVGDTMTLGGNTALDAAFTLGNITIHNQGSGDVALTVDDSADATGQIAVIGANSMTLIGGPTFVYGGASLDGLTFKPSSAGGNSIQVIGSPQLVAYATTIVDSAPAMTPDMIAIGDVSHPASGLTGDVTVSGAGATSLTIDDSSDTGQAGYLLQSGQFTIGASPVVDFSNATGLTGLTLLGGSGGNAWSVIGSPDTQTEIVTNPGAGLSGAVTLGNPANPASGLGAITIDSGGAGTTSLAIDDSGDMTSRSATLIHEVASTFSDLIGVAAGTISFQAGDLSSVSLTPGSNAGLSNSLTVDFSEGNPLPAGGAAFHYLGASAASNTLILQGELPGPTPIATEVVTPSSSQATDGTIVFGMGGPGWTLDFTGVDQPIADTVPVTSYSFLAPSSAQAVTVVGGPMIGPYQTDTIAGTGVGLPPAPAFSPVDFANKTNVLIDLTALSNPTYIPAPNPPAAGMQDFTVDYFGPDSSGKTLTVNGTTAGVTTTIDLAGTNNTVLVQGVTATGPLVVDVSGSNDAVVIGDAGSLAGILAPVTITGSPQSTRLTIDGSADSAGLGSMLLESDPDNSLSDLTGVLPGGTLAYDPAAVVQTSLTTGSGADSLTVDFANGNPLFASGVTQPLTGSPTFAFDAGAGGATLTFQDSADPQAALFNTETYAPTGPGSGTVSFFQNSATDFQGAVQFNHLTPTVDSTPVTNYTFAPVGPVGAVALTDGAAGYALISDPSSSPTFESVAYSNKTNVTIDLSRSSQNGAFILNNPTTPTGEATLGVKLSGGIDTVGVSANPANVSTMIDGGLGTQAITVNGAGLAAGTTSSNFEIVGGVGPNTMRLNAQGTGGVVALTPASPPNPAVASFASGTSMAFINIGTLQEYATNDAPALAVASPVPTIPAQPGVPLVNVPVAVFTDADLIETSASYQATIDWGDGTAPTTGRITADPTTPGRYIISGSHAYTTTGNHAITVTLTDLGGTFNATLANAGGMVVPVSTQLDAIAAVSGQVAQVSVTSMQVVSTKALAATAGTSATAGALGVFTDANGPADASGYYGLINWGDGTSVSPATIVADPNHPGQFQVGGTHTYAAPGGYTGTIQVFVKATGQGLSIPMTATAQAPSVLVTPGLTATGGVPTGDLTVASVSVPAFLGAPGLDYTGYWASVNYGDGSAAVPASLAPASVAGATAFHVLTSGHTYAKGGTYTLSVTIRDAAGVILGTASAPVSVAKVDPPTPTPVPTPTPTPSPSPSPSPTPTPPPAFAWGRLSPQSDSGISDSDGITNVTTPTFVGGATPGAVVHIYEAPAGSGAAPVLIASGVANAAGTWSATVAGSSMTDGVYQITATATNGGGTASMALGTVVTDTVPPVITNISLDRARGQLAVFYQDNLSGVYLADLSNGANYQVTATPLNSRTSVRRNNIVSRINVIPGATATSVDEALVVLNRGRSLNPGHYTITVLGGGISDIAGNLLNGRFYGTYPSGNMDPGGNYVGQITSFPRKNLGAFPIQAGYAKPRPISSSQPMARAEGHAMARARHQFRVRTAARQVAGNAAHPVDQAITSLLGDRRRGG